MTSTTLSPSARRLRDAHVSFLLQQCRGQALRRLIRLQVEGVLSDLAPVPVAELLSRETLKSLVVTTVQKLDLGPEFASLVGAMARQMYDDPISDEMTLAEVLPEVGLEVLFEQIMGLSALRETVIHELVHNPVFAGLVADLLRQGIGDFLRSSSGMERVPGAPAALKLVQEMLSKASAGKALDAGLKRFVTRRTRASLQSSEDYLNTAFSGDSVGVGARQVWESVRDRPLAEFRELISAQEVEDLAMLITAFWRDLRNGDFMAAMLEAAVDGFYTRHEQSTVATVLDELGVTQDLWRTVLSQALPEILQNLEARGVLQRMLERLLDDFYTSDDLAEALASL